MVTLVLLCSFVCLFVCLFVYLLGEREFYWGRRYFPTEDTPRNGTIGERPLRYPSANLPARIPKDRESLLRQIERVSRDLCILYCRMAVFRIMRSYPKLKDRKSSFLDLLLSRKAITGNTHSTSTDISAAARALSNSPNKSNSSEVTAVIQSSSPAEESSASNQLNNLEGCLMDRILLLIRLSCASTQRTKIYLQTVAMLHSVSHLPQNIGSVFAAGGAPMLEQLRHPLSDMLLLTASTPRVSWTLLSSILCDFYIMTISPSALFYEMKTNFLSFFSSYTHLYLYYRTPLHRHRNWLESYWDIFRSIRLMQ